MIITYGDHTASRTTAIEWARHFKDEQLNIEDNPRCCRPTTAADHQTVEVVEGLIIKDLLGAIQQIAYAVAFQPTQNMVIYMINCI